MSNNNQGNVENQFAPMSRRSVVAGLAGGVSLASLPSIALADGKKLKIALSNSYIGAQWRVEMENLFKAALQMEPYKSQVQGSYYNADNSIPQQTQQISGLIAEDVDAILVDAASPTGLNGIIEQARARNILVVSFDNTVTAPGVLKIEADQFQFGVMLAQWLVKKLNGKGNVIMVTGVSGTTVDEQRNAGADSVWKQYPGINVVSRFSGEWNSAVAEKNTASILPSLPKIDGIWCQGGEDGVLKAFIADNRPLPFTAGEGSNGIRKFMIGYMGHKVEALSVGNPPYLVLVALELARRVLKKEYPAIDVKVPFPYVDNNTVKVGETVFPDLPDSFFADFTDSGPNAVVSICVDAALHGTACGGSLNVRLPEAS